MNPLRKSPLWRLLFSVLASFAFFTEGFAQSKRVEELRIQKVGDVAYFHLRLQSPADLVAEGDRFGPRGFFAPPTPSLSPRLVAADGQLSVVSRRLPSGREERDFGPGRFDRKEIFEDKIKDDFKDKKVLPNPKAVVDDAAPTPREPVPVEGLEFVGRCQGRGVVRAKLLYPVAGKRLPIVGRLVRTPPPIAWKEIAVTLDFDRAKVIAAPPEAAARAKLKVATHELARFAPVRDDLEGLWAVAQIEQFLGLDQEVNDFGFYQFAATATARKYHVNSFRAQFVRNWRGDISRPNAIGPGGPDDHRQLFEMTTGAAAITESLQLRRMNAPRGAFDDTMRSIPIGSVKGIDIQEHPWQKMMGDKKPAPEAMAKLTPHDNYYVHFKNFAAFQDFGELLDQWGTNVLRAYEINSRDHRLKQRYEQQLCLKSTLLGKTLGPLIISGVAITGNDPFLREGTDVAILFQVKSKPLFLAAVDPFVVEARKKHAKLKEDRVTYKEVAIERFVTPLREVSLHRATLGDVVVYANSLAGIERIIDTRQGGRKAVADSLDFQYMRTVFAHDDADEDGFVFLPDAFIRNLVGPATKIKEKRRLEALASLHMLTHGALFASWDAGKAAGSLESLLSMSTLTPDEVPMPEGKPATWQPFQLVAHSDVYNTLHFATPLIELPIDNITRREAEEYERFRLEYLGLWREFFDPIGMRLSLKKNEVKVETYILPLIENSAYNRLRATTGNGTTDLAPAAIPAHTLAQYLQHVNLENVLNENVFGGGRFGGPRDSFVATAVAAIFNPLGKWVFVRLDDSPAIERLVKAIDKMDQGEAIDGEEIARQAWQLPVVFGADIRNPVSLTAALTALRIAAMNALPGGITWEPLDKEYKNVAIVRVGATRRARDQFGLRTKSADPFLPAVYYAMIDGAFYLTLNEPTLKGVIDSIAAQKDGKLPTVAVNSSLYFSPAAAIHTQSVLQRILERQTHEQAMKSLPIWYALHRANVVSKDATAQQADDFAYGFLGFVPVSPEGAAFKFDAARDEVVNERHGSFRKPIQAAKLADNAPLHLLLQQLRSVRADLRFREDGIHTVFTLDRGKAATVKEAE